MIYERAITLLSGRYGGRAAPQAYLEFAQEHFLAWMAAEGLFDEGHLVFKGGTALRKFKFGLAGRFSTDLDFAAEDAAYPEHPSCGETCRRSARPSSSRFSST